ncbi:MAG: T9SS type A sorting domain-containing protein [Vicingaceae bacterium]|nr:T9SS type A sorting domain-containing protein [Vicingaceae bacterium]
MDFKTKIAFSFLLINLFFIEVNAQIGFNRSDHIDVLKINGDTLKNAWTGGFNSVQFSEIDLNLDGIKDLFVFDKTGNRISTFINDGTPNEVSYHYDPSYIQHFQKGFTNWVLLRDYNCDGKIDIMSYYSGGIRTYKNVSTTTLDFELDTIAIKSNYNPDGANPSFINLFVSPTDLPAIDDIDGDGDLDILTFSILGSYVEYHKNLSMENNGTCDSLTFELSNKCWGFFHENLSNNSVTLYDTCDFNVSNPQKPVGGNKHAGSTLLTLDIDANNTKDLVLGDVSFNNFTMLTNTDTSPNLNKSSITAQDSLFPRNNNSTIATDIEIFPAGFYLDVNNDNIKDLIASPNCNSGCKNDDNVWYYNNSGANNNPNFNFIKKDFLQSDMIEIGEGAHPVFFDYNADGLIDIIIGNYGFYEPSVGPLLYLPGLSLYENIGSTTFPAFQLITKDYAGISTINLDINNSRPTLGLHPTFKDLDGDNDFDMILGDYNGRLHYFTNTAGAGNPANFTLTTPDFSNIDVGNDATPLLYDLDKDGLNDLIVGKKTGTFSYYKNVGTSTTASFSLITDSLGKVITKRSADFNGNSNPQIIDSAGTTLLFSGSTNGFVYKFGNIDGNLTGTFSVDSAFQNTWEGINSIISITDINNDNKLDMLLGNQSGGLTYFDGSDTIVTTIETETNIINEINLYPNPTNGLININFGKNNLKNATLQVIDLLGKVIQTEDVTTQKTTLNLNKYSKGIYLVKFSNENGNKIYKVIKE